MIIAQDNIKKTLSIIGILIVSFNLSGFKALNDWPKDRDIKKIEKKASKTWMLSPVKMVELKALDFTHNHKYKTAYKILNNQEIIGYGYVGRVKTCRSGGCSAPPQRSTNSHYEYFDYFMLLEPNMEIRHLEMLTYNATRGYEITSRSWLRQFVGYQGESHIDYGKDIQAISGATISANSMTEDVRQTVLKLKKLTKTHPPE